MILEKAGMKKDEEAYQAFVHDIQNLNYINKLTGSELTVGGKFRNK